LKAQTPHPLRGEPVKCDRSCGPIARQAGNQGRLPWTFLRSRKRSRKGAGVRVRCRDNNAALRPPPPPPPPPGGGGGVVFLCFGEMDYTPPAAPVGRGIKQN